VIVAFVRIEKSSPGFARFDLLKHRQCRDSWRLVDRKATESPFVLIDLPSRSIPKERARFRSARFRPARLPKFRPPVDQRRPETLDLQSVDAEQDFACFGVVLR
jgi:hypothetical protein